MPLSDGKWHQLTMVYSKHLSEFRLYYDGNNVAIYKVGFDFVNDLPLVLGAKQKDLHLTKEGFLPQINDGVKPLQIIVDAFDEISTEQLKNKEFLNFIVEPERLLQQKSKDNNSANSQKMRWKKISLINKTRKQLLANP